jgi:hypothetical protein
MEQSIAHSPSQRGDRGPGPQFTHHREPPSLVQSPLPRAADQPDELGNCSSSVHGNFEFYVDVG